MRSRRESVRAALARAWGAPVWTAFAAAASLACFGACSRAEEAPRVASPRPVVVFDLAWTDPGVALELTGVVRPWNVEDIAFEVGGRLDYVVEAGTLLRGRWQEGDELISEGDVLARLDPVPFETGLQVGEADVEAARVRVERVLPAQLKAAQARLVQDEQEFEGTEAAGRTNAVSSLDVIRARAKLDSSKASVEQLEAEIESAAATLAKARASLRQRQLDLDNALLHAPFDGEVSETYVRAGGYVSPGEPVARLVTMNPVLIELAVSAKTARLIGIDDAAQLFLEGRRIEQRGKVYQKSTVADPATRTFSVKVITRNLRRPVDEPRDPGVLELPRVTTVMPVIRLDPQEDGPLFVEEGALGEDEQGSFVWRAEGVVADVNLDPGNPSFVVRKVRVELGERRINFQKVFTFRELAERGDFEDFEMAALGVPDGVRTGDRVALIHETWQLSPGDLVSVALGHDQGAPGYYVPVEAISRDVEGVPHVFLVEPSDGGHVARRVAVETHGAFGTTRRITADSLEAGQQLVLRGVHYLQDGERVSVTR